MRNGPSTVCWELFIITGQQLYGTYSNIAYSMWQQWTWSKMVRMSRKSHCHFIFTSVLILIYSCYLFTTVNIMITWFSLDRPDCRMTIFRGCPYYSNPNNRLCCWWMFKCSDYKSGGVVALFDLESVHSHHSTAMLYSRTADRIFNTRQSQVFTIHCYDTSRKKMSKNLYLKMYLCINHILPNKRLYSAFETGN